MATQPTLPHGKMEVNDSTEKAMKLYNKTMESLSIEQLRAALLRSLHREVELQSQLSPPVPERTAATSTSRFFNKLPRELRDRIYKCLLVNPDFSTTKFLKGWRQAQEAEDKDAIYNYGLSPQILQVCSQAYDEALPILYESNTFIIEFVSRDYVVQSPILRFPFKERNHFSYSKYLQGAYPWVTKVKNWKIILTTNSQDILSAPDPSLTYFCRHLCFNKPKSLEVLLLPQGDAIRYIARRLAPAGSRTFHDVKDTLQPLRMLRNVQSLKVGEVQGSDLPFTYDLSLPLVSNNIPAELKVELKTLVEGDSPINYVFMMYEKLIAYAQAFERNNRFRAEMNSAWGVARHNRDAETRHWSTLRDYNPYKQEPAHPVETNLTLASIASEDNDTEILKQARKVVLEYLEPQYQKIVAQAAAMAEFVKHEKRDSGERGWQSRFEFDSPPHKDLLTTCLLFLEDYAEAFVRDVPSHTKFHIRKEQDEFDFFYSTLEREILMKKLSNVHAMRTLAYASREWRRWFRAAVDDMDKQYLGIRRARKALFKFDADEDHGCDIDLELWRCDEMIDWRVTEPNMKPTRLPTAAELLQYEQERAAAEAAEAAEGSETDVQGNASTIPHQNRPILRRLTL